MSTLHLLSGHSILMQRTWTNSSNICCAPLCRSPPPPFPAFPSWLQVFRISWTYLTNNLIEGFSYKILGLVRQSMALEEYIYIYYHVILDKYKILQLPFQAYLMLIIPPPSSPSVVSLLVPPLKIHLLSISLFARILHYFSLDLLSKPPWSLFTFLVSAVIHI